MNEQVPISWGEYEAGAELKWILAKPVLPVPGSPGPRSGLRVVAAEDMKQIRRPQLCRLVRRPIRIYQQWERDARLVAK